MFSRLTGLIFTLITWTLLYAVMPVRAVQAASNELNLDISDEPKVTPMPSMFVLFLKLVVSLVIIVGLAYLTMKLLRKNMKVLSRGVNINVLDQYAFSLNKAVYITQIAGRVYVLGVSDHNISVITEITDRDTIDEMVARAREREMEPIIPPSFLERLLPASLRQDVSAGKSFQAHIRKQVKKLESLVGNRVDSFREDDKRNE